MKNNLINSTLIVGAFFLSNVSLGQKKEETSAAVAYKNTFASCMGNGDIAGAKKALIEAKKRIDLAAEHEETKESQKTLYLKGCIYSSFLMVGMQSQDTAFIKLAGDDAIDVAIAAFKKGYAIKGKFNSDIEESVQNGHDLMENFSMMLYKAEQFKEAAEAYKTEAQYFDAVNRLDSNSIYNAGLCYDRSGDYSNAAKEFEILAKAGYRGATTYAYASNSYRKAKEYDAAKAIVAIGRTKYPQDKEILLEAVNTCLDMNDAVGAETLLTEAITKDPKNKLLHLTIGSIYIDLKQNEKAEASINEALKIDPEYEDALYQSGAHLVTWAGSLIAETGQLKYNDPKVKVLEAQAQEIYNRAIPPLEKYVSKKPNDKDVLTILYKLYRSVGNTDKSAEYKKRVEALK